MFVHVTVTSVKMTGNSSSVSEVTLPGIDYPNEVLCGFLEYLLVHISLILLDAS
jgi:hypothetical protein